MSARARDLTPDTVVVATGGYISAEVDGELVLFDADRCLYHGLDAIGAEILGLVQAPTRLDRVIATLAERYDGSPNAIAADTRDLLAALLDAGLLRVDPQDAAA